MSRAALLTVALAGLGACAGRAPVLADPFSREPGAPLAVYSIDYWHAMMEASTVMEFVPREFATPAVDPTSGRVVVGTRDGVLRSVTIEGKVRWAVQTPAPFYAGVLIRDGVIYSPGGDGILRALKADTGAVLWTYDCGEELVTVPVLAEGRLLVASQSATLYAVDAADGKWVWQYRRTPPAGFILRGASTPVVRDGVVYLGFSDGHAAALDAKTGGAIWDRVLSTGTQFIDVSSTPGFDSAGHLIVASYKDGLFALDAEDRGHRVAEHCLGPGLRPRPGLGHLRLRRGPDRRVQLRDGEEHLAHAAARSRGHSSRRSPPGCSWSPPDGRCSSWTR